MKKQNSSTDLGALQSDAESAAKILKGARTVLATSKLAFDRADEAYCVAQKALQAGVEQVKASTKVS